MVSSDGSWTPTGLPHLATVLVLPAQSEAKVKANIPIRSTNEADPEREVGRHPYQAPYWFRGPGGSWG